MSAARAYELERGLYVPSRELVRPRRHLQLVPRNGPLQQRDVLRSSGAVASSGAWGSNAGPTPPAVPNLYAYLVTNQSQTIGNAVSGSGDSIAAPVGATQVLTDGAGLFLSNQRAQRIVIAGATNPANNGSFPVSNVPDGSHINYENAAGVAQAVYGGNWNLPGTYTALVDLANARAFAGQGVGPALDTQFTFPVCARPFANLANALQYTNATVSGFQGVDACFSARVRLEAATTLQAAEISNGAATNRILFFVNTSGEMGMTWTAGGASTSFVSVGLALPAATWVTLGWKLNFAARTMSSFVNGALAHTTAAGTARNPTGLTTLDFAGFFGGGSGVGWLASGAFGWGWSAANELAVHNSFLAYGTP